MQDRNLLDVTHILCARLTAQCEAYRIACQNSARIDIYYTVIEELCCILIRMPFTAEEGAFVHRALEPLITKYGETLDGKYYNKLIEPLVKALEQVPGKPDAQILVVSLD